MGGKLLDQEYGIVMAAGKQKVDSAPDLGLTSDGWSNTRGEHLLNFILLTPEPVFWKAVEVKKQREDAFFVAGELEKVIVEIGPMKISTVITDNVIHNILAWDIIMEKFPHISCVGDPAHVLDLLMEDIDKINSLKRITQMSKKVYKGIRFHS